MLGARDQRWMGFLTRSVMENATSYDDAYNMLTKTSMLAPAYFILAGNKSRQASVITRARTFTVDVLQMNSTEWYLVQTNYDHWEKPLFIDDRRTPAERCLNKKTQDNMAFPALYDILYSKPVRNKLTSYTALMQ